MKPGTDPGRGRFPNRAAAGKALAARLAEFEGRNDVVVLALPRGGVPVGAEIAKALGALLDVEVVRKLGVPGQKELAFGALASDGVVVFNDDIIRQTRLSADAAKAVIEREEQELKRRSSAYRKGRRADIDGRIVIIVDDGLATGATMRAAVASVRKRDPARIIIAVPVASPEICEVFESEPDTTCVVILKPRPLYGVGWWYEDFRQTSDEEVCRMLIEAGPEGASVAGE